MIGLNGGLMGVRRVTTTSAAPGLWVPNEQVLAERADIWPNYSDPSFASVSLLLHMDGTNASTAFTDNSANALTFTANGSAQISTAQSKFGGASGFFNGTGTSISTPNNNVLNLSSGDFTIEFWLFATSFASALKIFDKDGVFGASFPSMQCSVSTAGALSFLFGDGTGGSTYASYGCGTIATGQWYHVAATRSGTTIKTFLGGTEQTSTTPGVTIKNGTKALYIGSAGASVSGGAGNAPAFNGYIDDFRITKGVSRYNATFTPPTSPFPNY
jgi:hypothetical protein